MLIFKSRSLAAAFGFGLILVGCSSSSATTTDTDAGKGDGASAGAATFTEVYAIITKSTEGDCTDCHKGASPSANLDMSTQATAYANFVGKPPTTNTANDCASLETTDDLEIVKPGDPVHSLLYLKISETTPPCGAQMPLHRQVLTAAEIATFSDWITAGAKDD